MTIYLMKIIKVRIVKKNNNKVLKFNKKHKKTHINKNINKNKTINKI